MKYLRTFENISNDDVKNKILVLDCSGSMSYILLNVLEKINLYLSEKFTAFLCAYDVIAIYNVSLNELIDKIKKDELIGGGILVQEGINYIINNVNKSSDDLKGRILLITDGFDSLNLRNLHNDISILCIDNMNVNIIQNNFKTCQIFHEDLESLEQGFYLPRDITYANYELKANAQKYNL